MRDGGTEGGGPTVAALLQQLREGKPGGEDGGESESANSATSGRLRADKRPLLQPGGPGRANSAGPPCAARPLTNCGALMG